MKKLFILIASAILFCTAVFAQKQAVKPPFSRGVTFSYWLEQPSADLVNRNFHNEQDIKNVKTLGCECIRLPVHFENLSSGAPNYTIDPRIFAILDKMVEWASKNEIYLIIDNHTWDAFLPTPSDIEKRLVKVWGQVAERYKDSGKYVVYEILNEPHGIDLAKWGKAQQKAIDAIRKFDTTHTIIVGSGNWQLVDGLDALPKYSDKNLMYSFHYYDPLLFTQQGEGTSSALAFKNIPFPYSKEKMPPKPQGLNSEQKWRYDNYEKDASPESMQAALDKAAEFSAKRNAPIICTEFGVKFPTTIPSERHSWYNAVIDYFENRNLAWVTWDYYESYGVFTKERGGFFPDDLNRDLLKALRFKQPAKTAQNIRWDEKAKRTGDYTIYHNGFTELFTTFTWLGDNTKLCAMEKIDGDGSIIDLPKMSAYNNFYIYFNGGARLLQEKNSGYALEFEARTNQKNLKMQVFFRNSNKTGQEWRAIYDISNREVPADGKWHKVRILLNNFKDVGAWNNAKQVWVNSNGRNFDWNDVQNLLFENQDKEITSGISFREIRLTK